MALEPQQVQHTTSIEEAGPGFFDYLQVCFSSTFAIWTAILASAYLFFAITFSDISALDAGIIFFGSICFGALLHFLFFQLPFIAFSQVIRGGPVKKVIGAIGIVIFGAVLY
jgi:hypothetical protein